MAGAAKKPMAKKAARRPAQPKPQAAKAKKSRPRTKTGITYKHALDARVPVHLPPPVSMGPYTVVRDLVRTTVTTGAQNVVGLFGAYQTDYSGALGSVAPTPNYTTVVGYTGTGTQAPLDWTQIESGWANTRAVLAGAAPNVQVCLHAMTISVQNSKGTALTEGFVYIGQLTGNPNRGGFGDANALATNLLRRKEMRRHSSVDLGMSASEIVAIPVDMTQWSMMDPLYLPGRAGVGFNDTATNRSRDSLNHLALVFTPTGLTEVVYSIEISTEWRVIYNNDTELASTHSPHPPTPQSVWNSVKQQAEVVEGRLASAVGNVASRMFGGAMSTLGRNAGRALGVGLRRMPAIAFG
jgi:hypothetical protein